MKQFSPIQWQVLDRLADGQCHNGNALGDLCGVSRTAIWKQIKQLIAMGARITCVPQQGYQLTHPFIALDEDRIRSHLSPDDELPSLRFHLCAEVDSTNKFLKELGANEGVQVCCAEKQTRGRGRFGRQWASPFGENIYLSSRWKLECCLSRLSGLSLVVSLAILDSLNQTLGNNDIRIKWPNDLLWNHKKLCGVLIEAVAETNACAQVIIGIGLNVNTGASGEPLTDNPWCSLFEINGHYIDRNKLIASILQSLARYMNLFLQNDFTCFQKQWQQVDYLKGHYISTVQSGKTISGHATGVTDQGLLCLVDEEGKQHILSSGDTSLKRDL